MELLESIYVRHSVRQYTDRKINAEDLAKINNLISEINEKSGLSIQFLDDCSKMFDNLFLKAIGWSKVPYALILKGKSDIPDLAEKCGYYGEYIVLTLQSMGINTCWAGFISRKKVTVPEGETLVLGVAAGYGENQGRNRSGKKAEDVCDPSGKPEWFMKGVECALLAPTAINQQKFHIDLVDNKPVFTTTGRGPHIDTDLGIIKCHFEIGSGVSVL